MCTIWASPLAARWHQPSWHHFANRSGSDVKSGRQFRSSRKCQRTHPPVGVGLSQEETHDEARPPVARAASGRTP